MIGGSQDLLEWLLGQVLGLGSRQEVDLPNFTSLNLCLISLWIFLFRWNPGSLIVWLDFCYDTGNIEIRAINLFHWAGGHHVVLTVVVGNWLLIRCFRVNVFI